MLTKLRPVLIILCLGHLFHCASYDNDVFYDMLLTPTVFLSVSLLSIA